MHPRELQISNFTYELPEKRIATYPLNERDESRLLIYKNGSIASETYKNIPQCIPPGASLFFNNTKVVEARLLFEKPTGGVIEIFCLEPHEQYLDLSAAMTQQGKVLWRCMVGGASKWKHGQVLQKQIKTEENTIDLSASYIDKQDGYFVIQLCWSPGNMSFAELLHHAGAIPLPPYIKRNAEESDTYRYQTIYALADGSVAAPTAGLHFSETIFKAFKEKNIHSLFVTLHVGAGTFKPVKSETMSGHEMHAEFISVHNETIQYLIDHFGSPIIAVGTTSLRTIESLYWLGVKLADPAGEDIPTAALNSNIVQTPELDQWEVYDMASRRIPVLEALNSLQQYLHKNNLSTLHAKTRIIIAPGYSFKIVDALVTNFHQPQSTLLLLVAALIGDDWKKVYAYALENNFRFLSYGDGSLLWKKEPLLPPEPWLND